MAVKNRSLAKNRFNLVRKVGIVKSGGEYQVSDQSDLKFPADFPDLTFSASHV